MAPPSKPEKAYLQVIDTGAKIECLFNPKDYSISRANSWNAKAVVGKDQPTIQFGGGNAGEMSFELLFDASESASGDVRDRLGDLFDLLKVREAQGAGKNKGKPPTVQFGWGSTVTPKAVVKSLNVQYTLFRPDGTPIRALAKLALMQVEQPTDKRQNPTTTGLSGVRSHTVRDGDSLQSIAYAVYGDPTRWRLVAEANGIDDPMRVVRGTVLAIPVET